jgi:hypothetical protein
MGLVEAANLGAGSKITDLFGQLVPTKPNKP